MAGVEKVIPTICHTDCGGQCVLKVHVRDGVITRIETDDGDELQYRACMKGRSRRQVVYAPERLKYPMKRMGDIGNPMMPPHPQVYRDLGKPQRPPGREVSPPAPHHASQATGAQPVL